MAHLRMSALQVGADTLASSLVRPAAGPAEEAHPWWPIWCWWRSIQPTVHLGTLSDPALHSGVTNTAEAGPVIVLAMRLRVEARSLETGMTLAVHHMATGEDPSALAVLDAGDRLLVAIGTDAGGLHLLDVPQLERIASRPRAHQGIVSDLCFLREQRRSILASASADGSITTWSIPDLTPLATQRRAHRMAFSLTRATLGESDVVISGGDTVENGIYHEEDSIRVWSPRLEPIAGFGRERSLVERMHQFDSGGRRLLLTCFPRADLWDLDAAGHLADLSELGIDAISAGDLGAGEVLLRVTGGIRLMRSTISADGTVAVEAGNTVETPHGNIAGPIAVYGRSSLVSAGADLRLWDLEEVRASLSIADAGARSSTPGPRGLIEIVTAGDTLVALSPAGHLYRWHLDGTRLTPTDVGAGAVALGTVRIGGRPHALIGYQSGRLRAVDAASLEEWPVEARGGARLTALCGLSALDGALVATAVDVAPGTGAREYAVRIWNMETGEEVLAARPHHFRFPLRAHGWADKPFYVLASGLRDGTPVLAAAGAVTRIIVWDAVTFDLVTELWHDYVDVASLAVAGGMVAAGFIPGRVALWSLDTFEQVADMPDAHRGRVNALALLTRGDDLCLATGADDGLVRVWTTGGELMMEIQVNAPVTRLAVMDVDLLAVATGQGLMVVSLSRS